MILKQFMLFRLVIFFSKTWVSTLLASQANLFLSYGLQQRISVKILNQFIILSKEFDTIFCPLLSLFLLTTLLDSSQ